jgi:hypothetical protein
VVLTILDGALTLFGQSLAYWAGEYAAAHEFSPLGAAFLHFHPAAFAGLMLVWIGVIILVGLLLREPWGHIWSLMIVIGHSTGSFDWLEDLDCFGALLLFFAASLMTVFCWRKAGSIDARRPASEGPPIDDPSSQARPRRA